jgi:hypothetical protein
VSLELLEDSGVDIEAYISLELGRAIGRLEGDAFATGASGSATTPEGVINKGAIGVTTAAAGGLVDHLGRVHRHGVLGLAAVPHRRLVADVGRDREARSQAQGLAGRYIWQEALTKDEQATFLGYPVSWSRRSQARARRS